MRKRIACALLVCAALLSGCKRAAEPVKFTTFAMDTVMDITLYGQDRDKTAAVYETLADQISELDSALSVTGEDSDIARINRGSGTPVEVDPGTAQLLSQALELCRVTEGALDITAYPAVKAWGFTVGEHRVPSKEELAALAADIDYAAVQLEGDAHGHDILSRVGVHAPVGLHSPALKYGLDIRRSRVHAGGEAVGADDDLTG